MARELDDAILTLRTNELDIGTWLLKTEGDAARRARRATRRCCAHADHWFVRETIGMLRRTLARLDVSSRTLFALVEPGSCFAGTLLELALAADRTYMLALPDEPETRAEAAAVGEINFGLLPDGRTASRAWRAASTTRHAPLAARARRASARRSTPTPRSRSASSPPRPTTSTGTTRSASRSRSARACRPTR